MLEEPDGPDSQEDQFGSSWRRYLNAKFIGIIAVLLIVASIITEMLNRLFSLGLPAGMAFVIGILMATVFACCMSLTTIGSIGMKLPEYGEMEQKFQTAKEFYDNREWREALILFKELHGERMDHKRALYYGAKCYEQLNDWEMVKQYCQKYLEMQSKDKEVWESGVGNW